MSLTNSSSISVFASTKHEIDVLQYDSIHGKPFHLFQKQLQLLNNTILWTQGKSSNEDFAYPIPSLTCS